MLIHRFSHGAKGREVKGKASRGRGFSRPAAALKARDWSRGAVAWGEAPGGPEAMLPNHTLRSLHAQAPRVHALAQVYLQD